MATDDPGASGRRGSSEVLPYHSQIEAVHLALLPTGKVLYYSGFRMAVGERTETRVWDPTTGEIKEPATPSDIFCSGHSFLPSGELLTTGGTLEYVNVPSPWLTRLAFALESIIPVRLQALISDMRNVQFTGPTGLYRFDPWQEEWKFAGDMRRGRWYPTACTLPDGGVLILAGRDEARGVGSEPESVKINEEVEVYYQDRGLIHNGVVKGPGIRPSAHAHGYKTHSHQFPTEYPRLHVIPLLNEQDRRKFPEGRVFCSGYGPETKMLNLATMEWEHVDDLRFEKPRHDGNCVLLPLDPDDGYRPRVLTFGGSEEISLRARAIDTAEIIDLSEEYPRWRYLTHSAESGTLARSEPRVNGCAVQLPDGVVMALGGNSTARWDDPVYTVETFDPVSEAWDDSHRPIRVKRGYHATAVLLPDARVLIAGTTPAGPKQLKMEVYSPYYLDGDPSRPRITTIDGPGVAPDGRTVGLEFGGTFRVGFESDQPLSNRVSLMRPGAMTHAFDMDQRLIWLKAEKDSHNELTIEAPPDAHVAPPGYYMIFLLDENGVPAVGEFVWLPVAQETGEEGRL